MKVLIVDDDAVDRRVVRRTLSASGDTYHEVQEASSVAEGLELLDGNQFDVILLDCRMPEVDGIEMVTDMHAKPDMGNTAVVMISASDDPALALQCIEAGAQDYISKNEITLAKLERAILHANKRFEIEQRMHMSYLEVKKMAEMDPLTGLSNRYHFEETLKVMIASNKRDGSNVALLALDLDNFKHVNDTMGHEAGDSVLKQSVKRIRSCLRNNEGFARLGGDEFAIILGDIARVEDVNNISNRVLNSFKQPFNIQGKEFVCGVSIGVALCPVDSGDSQALLKCADIAMYRAKQDGKNGIRFYEPHYQIEFNQRYIIHNALTNVLENDSFRLFYQPIFCAKSDKLLGFEALIRWPEAEICYTPDVFIPVAEQSKLIDQIGRWVIETAIAQLSTWHQRFDENLTLSINISPVQLQNDGLLSEFQRTLEAQNVLANNIILEITETALIKDNSKVTHSLNILSENGFKIALDDFGMGFSSVAHLMDYPIDIVKLDKSMQATMQITDKRLRVFEALALMLKKLDFIVVAEGIETQNQVSLCQKFELDRLQGYLLGMPMDVSKCSAFLALHHKK
ncbi:response regulator receiver modulated diguanylate cyclase/phosphodiesterase [Paraglaciecola sp. T6c]|uniref:two-component system response regulator n=1 Tax=Pseudoalteromonas atlantica (strain T6c / ATCC BAA-1087) TaxID=3042615 RepID=UPI00005C63FA|nr:GGDEF domain-containing response regulator [Paraglaciecola sp. T6c]ABG42047.1 response regulator receiver modulated diguanylate cyclase/phosphodiesterase [Paraglaciecola sp. T6c]